MCNFIVKYQLLALVEPGPANLQQTMKTCHTQVMKEVH
jgi:hypothetical protein